MKKQKKFFETSEFNKEQAKWYALLKEDGFRDTETIRDIKNNNINPQMITVNDEWVVYNDKCRAFLNSGKLSDPLGRFILEQHSEGLSNREIARSLEENGFETVTPRTIDRRLIEILDEAEIDHIVFKV